MVAFSTTAIERTRFPNNDMYEQKPSSLHFV